MNTKSLVKFCRLRLGLKPIIDYAQSRHGLLGIVELPIRTVFDVGANVGKRSRQYLRLFPEAQIYSFEPVPHTYAKLARWAQAESRVRPFNLALGGQAGATTMHWNQTCSGGSTIVDSVAVPGECQRISVLMDTLDAVAARLPIQDQILVKIDVEGFDMEVVRGGMDVLRRAAAAIIEIATPEAPTDRPAFPDFMHVMTDLGFMYRGNLACAYVDGKVHLVDAVFIKPPARRKPVQPAN